MADSMQFLSETACQIFARFSFLETESEQNFGFPHIPNYYHTVPVMSFSSLLQIELCSLQ